MRTKGSVVLLLAVVGCGAPQGKDAGWVQAGDALAAHGVTAYRTQATADGQQVLLRGDGDATIGTLTLAAAPASTTVTLEFRADTWQQVIAAASGEMTLTLDGRQATLTWNGTAWVGSDAAQALLADSQPYVDFVQLVGVTAKLGVTTAPAAAPSSDASTAPWDGGTPPPGHPQPPPSCCGDVVTTASGWAWYWEKDAQAMACKRATDTLQLDCNAASGYDCCNLPAEGACTSCVDWGTGWACATAGDLQYACK